MYAFVSLDSIALEPHFRNARQSGAVQTTELDEGMFLLGLQAAAWRVPFLPTACGLGSDVMRLNPSLATVKSPYADGEVLVAMPALELDVALIHMHRGDQGGTGQCLGVDPYFDDLMCMAARKRFMSVEQIVDTDDFLKLGPPQSIRINRLMTDGVVETPHGAHFTECVPDYPRDEAFQRAYAASAKSDEAWYEFRAKYIDVSRSRVPGGRAMSSQTTSEVVRRPAPRCARSRSRSASAATARSSPTRSARCRRSAAGSRRPRSSPRW